jgi:hypothetical protein
MTAGSLVGWFKARSSITGSRRATSTPVPRLTLTNDFRHVIPTIDRIGARSYRVAAT